MLTGLVGAHGSDDVSLAATDTLAVKLTQTSGGTITLAADATANRIAIARIG